MHRQVSLFALFLVSTFAASAQLQPRSAQVNLYFPHFTNGTIYVGGQPSNQQWQTTFTFANVGGSTANVNLWLYDDNGNNLNVDFGSGATNSFSFTVPANGLYIMKSTFTTAAAVSGWAYAEAGVPVQATVAFRMFVNSVPQQELSAQPTLPTLTYTSPANAFLGVAMANPYTDAETWVDASLYNDSGVLVAGPVVVVIPPNGHVAFNPWQKFSLTDLNLKGVLRLTGDDPTFPDRFVAWTVNADSIGILSTLPAGDFGFPLSHFDRIWLVWSIILDQAYNLDASFLSSPVNLNILSDQVVNTFTNGTAEVDVTYGLSELINDSDSEMAFALAHQLGHIFQNRNGGLKKYVPGNAEADADQWALNILLASRYDPYSAPGALAKMAMATANSLAGSTFDGVATAAANTSLNARLATAYSALQTLCSGTNSSLCQEYKGVVHAGLPANAPLGIRRPAARAAAR
jgi:hypothetical protein